jgi:hypothetical protein
MTYEEYLELEGSGFSYMIEQIWNFTIAVARWTNSFWMWLNSPVSIKLAGGGGGGLLDFLNIKLTNFLPEFSIDLGVSWLQVFGGGFILTFMGLYLVKLFVPTA